VFILADYIENYLAPTVESNQRQQPGVLFKHQMKKAKLRQIIYKRLLEDFMAQSRNETTKMGKDLICETSAMKLYDCLKFFNDFLIFL
jgi:hypothetical protein